MRVNQCWSLQRGRKRKGSCLFAKLTWTEATHRDTPPHFPSPPDETLPSTNSLSSSCHLSKSAMQYPCLRSVFFHLLDVTYPLQPFFVFMVSVIAFPLFFSLPPFAAAEGKEKVNSNEMAVKSRVSLGFPEAQIGTLMIAFERTREKKRFKYD